MKYRIGILISLLFVCYASIGVCDPSTDAKQMYQKGKEQFEKNDFGAAAVSFKKAYDLKPTWRILFNLGQSLAASKQYGRALETFEKYIVEGGDDIPLERNDWVRAEITRLRDMVGAVDVVPPPDCSDGACRVLVDDTQRGVMPLPGVIKVAAGISHTVVIMNNDTLIFEKKVVVNSGDTVVVRMPTPEAEATPEPLVAATGSPSNTSSNNMLTAGWVTVGGGGALLIGGGILGAIALSKNKALKQSDDCSDTACGKPEYETLDSRDTAAVMSTILIGVGSAAVVTGVILIIRGNKSKRETLTMVPSIGRGAAGAFIVGTF